MPRPSEVGFVMGAQQEVKALLPIQILGKPYRKLAIEQCTRILQQAKQPTKVVRCKQRFKIALAEASTKASIDSFEIERIERRQRDFEFLAQSLQRPGRDGVTTASGGDVRMYDENPFHESSEPGLPGATHNRILRCSTSHHFK